MKIFYDLLLTSYFLSLEKWAGCIWPPGCSLPMSDVEEPLEEETPYYTEVSLILEEGKEKKAKFQNMDKLTCSLLQIVYQANQWWFVASNYQV